MEASELPKEIAMQLTSACILIYQYVSAESAARGLLCDGGVPVQLWTSLELQILSESLRWIVYANFVLKAMRTSCQENQTSQSVSSPPYQRCSRPDYATEAPGTSAYSST